MRWWYVLPLLLVALLLAGCTGTQEVKPSETPTEKVSEVKPTVTPYERPEIRTAEEAWNELMKGNERFVNGERAPRNLTAERIENLAGQHPFATVITCSDSRVCPEIIFDQGIGDIFVIRTAGNVVEPVVLGSIEYGVEHLHTPILVVLGHQSCGAVTATVQAVTSGEECKEGNICSIIEEIKPAVEEAEKTGKTGKELIEEAVNENVKLVTKKILQNSNVTRELVEKGELVIIGAKYYFDTGKVVKLFEVNKDNLEEFLSE